MPLIYTMLNNRVAYCDEESGDLIEDMIDGEEVADNDLNGPSSIKRVWNAFYSTPEGEQFRERYYGVPGNPEKLLAVFERLYPDGKFTCKRAIDSYATARAAGEFKEPAPEATSAAPARDIAGRFQNPLVLEYFKMLDDPSTPASAIPARMRVDAAFRAAVESESAPKPKRQTGMIVSEERRAELQAFAEAYRLAPSMKFFNGFVTIGDHRYTRTELDSLVEEASKLALL